MFSLLALSAWCTAIPLGTGCDPVVVHAPRATLRLALAANDQRRERGLMFVKHVPHAQGMLFVFPDGDQPRSFWMKNTIAPLDMIFVRSDGTVTAVAADVPATSPAHPGEETTRGGMGTYVIELGAGDAARDGIAVGTNLTIPTVPAQ